MGGLTITRNPVKEVSGMKADRPLAITKDLKRIVEAGTEEAAFLWARKGKVIPDDEAKQYGLKYKDGKVLLPEQQKAEAKAKPKPEDKAVKKVVKK